MTNDLETMLRSSLQQRADDVEPTPELWRQVERKVSRTRVLPLFLWTAAGAAAVLAAVTLLPNVLDGQGDLVIDPDPAGPSVVESPPADDGAVVTSTPSHYVAVSDGRLVLRTVEGSSEEVLVEMPAEGHSRVVTAAVRPGSSPDDLTVAVVTAAEGMYDLRLFHPTGGPLPDVVTGHISPALGPDDPAPTPVWSPDGSTIGWAARQLDGTATLELVSLTDALEGAGELAPDGGPVLTASRSHELSGDFEAARLRLQDWARTPDGERLALTADGRLLTTGIRSTQDGWELDTDGLLEVDHDGYVVDVATTAGGTLLLTAGGEQSQDAEDAGLALTVAGQRVGLSDLSTSDPSGVWMTAVDSGAIVGLGDEARLVLRTDDGLDVRPVDPSTSYAAFVPVAGSSPAPQPTPSPAESEAGGRIGADVLGPHLAVDDHGRLLLRLEGEDRLLYPDESVSPEAGVSVEDVSVRPGSTPDDLTAVALLSTEGGPELIALSYVDGTLTTTRMEGSHGIGADADYGHLQAPIWAPDGDHLAWLERGGDGTWGLRTIGWDDGPGTGRSADDNAGFGLSIDVDDLVAVEWIWGEGDDTEMTGSIFLVSRRQPSTGDASGLYRQDLVRMGDGALATTGDPVAIDVPVDGRVIGVRIGEASATYLVREDDGGVVVAFGPDGDPVPLPFLDPAPDTIMRMTGTTGEPIVMAGDKPWRVLADGRVESVVISRDIEFLG